MHQVILLIRENEGYVCVMCTYILVLSALSRDNDNMMTTSIGHIHQALLYMYRFETWTSL